MKKAFTLIELIFVIVIIGLLAAVAVPKFLNLKQNAESKSVIKTTVDGAQQAAEAAVNHSDLEDETSFQLSDILKIKGKGWSYTSAANAGRYVYAGPNDTSPVAEINFSLTSREVNYSINCNNFGDTVTQNKCKTDLNNASTSGVTSVRLTF
jgi:prepilin-type N-terminal cleavage/methylation domain-containing protein